MKQCVRCGKQVADNQQFCDNCGGTNFKPVVQQNRQQQQRQNMNRQGQQYQQHQQQQMQQMQQMQQQRQNMNGNIQRPNMNSNVQRPGQQRQQPARPNMNKGQTQQNQNGLNGQYDSNSFVDTANKQLKKVSKKEAQQREMKMLYAMKEAQERGEVFDEEKYKEQHGWYVTTGANGKAVSSSDSTVADWIKTLILMLIPIVNLIIAVSGMKNTSNPDYKRNYYKAFLIYYLAAFAISAAVAYLV